MKEFFYKSLLGGFTIGIGGAVYLMTDNKIAGAFLFSFGLICVLLRGYNLFTGWVAWAEEKDGFVGAIMLLLNFLGATCAAWMFGSWSAASGNAEALIVAKLSQPLWQAFLRGIACGGCMYLAVSGYRKNNAVIAVVMGVMVFILAGFEHCIADVFYLVAGGAWSFRALWFIVFVTIGNIIGAQAIRRLSCEN